jgi:hypothetical protein
MTIEITKADIDYALGPSPWDLGNQVLYSLCQNHPKHDLGEAIIAKVWLIGRSYAAAIERRKNAEETSDDFYEITVVEKIKKSNLDNWLANLPNQVIDPWNELGSVITVHKRLMDLFSDLTGLGKRALASKYLHFHRPDLFYIYDSRAKEAITKITPRPNEIKNITAEDSDSEYHIFCRRCQYLRDSISKRFGATLTPRQIDKILLRITDKIRKEKLEQSTPADRE